MPYGRGYGFRGWSSSWPYVGLGRGGLPRCWAYGGTWMPNLPWNLTREQEIKMLRDQAKVLQEQLEIIEKRIKDLSQIDS